MNEETKNTECEKECFCKKRFKDVLVIAIGSFVGVYCALSLFSALHRPNFSNVPCPMMMKHGPMYGQFGGFKHRHSWQRDGFKGDFVPPAPQKPIENK